MANRQVKWNMFIDPGEQVELRHRYTIAILNQPREIERIKQRFLLALAPADDFRKNYECLVPNSKGLHLEIFSFSSRKGEINESWKIYDSPNFKKDRNLSDRNEKRLERYVQNLMRG